MQIIGSGPAMTRLRDEISRVANSDAKVLITGPTGVGKDLVAQAIHASSRRRRGPFMATNCAGLPDTLLESELFGHTRGSFTDAHHDVPGKIRQSEGGTFFLDEVGDMSFRMQGLVLRFLDSGEIQTIGSNCPPQRVETRVIAATNANLRQKVSEGEFREDLFFRINVLEVKVPSLTEHPEDIPELFRHFAHVISNGSGHKPIRFTDEALGALHRYHWPGNVRELRGMVEKFLAYTDRDIIELKDLRLEERRFSQRALAGDVGSDIDRRIKRMVEGKESFWDVVHGPYMKHELTREHLLEIVRFGLTHTRGIYRSLWRLYNVDDLRKHKKLHAFLVSQDALLPFRDFRK